MGETADRIPREREDQRLAFEEYYALGGKRTYGAVAGKRGISPSTVKLWARTFGWRRRIAERDAATARQLADRSLSETVVDHDRHRKIVRLALLRLARGIAAGDVRMQMADLDRLIRLEAYLDGQQAGRGDWIDRETDPAKLRARLAAIVAAAGLDAEAPAASAEDTPDAG